MPTQLLTTHGAELAVRDSGGSGVPIVLLSGGPGMPDYLRDIAQMVAGRRVVSYDQRGTGQSRALHDDYSVAAHVADLECVRKSLGADRLHLFGHSWGGLLAKLYATEHIEAVASLFLCCPGIGVGRDWRSMERTMMSYTLARCGGGGLARLGLRMVLGRIPGDCGRTHFRAAYSQAWLNYQRPDTARPADPAVIRGVGPRAAVKTRASAIALPRVYLDRVLPRAYVPMHVIFGEDDIFGDLSRGLAARYPNAHVEFWSGCGHLPWIDDQARFREALNAFYSEMP